MGSSFSERWRERLEWLEYEQNGHKEHVKAVTSSKFGQHNAMVRLYGSS